jgi:hypothetical protein
LRRDSWILGFQRIYLTPQKKNNLRARRLYENCAFVETGEWCKEIQGLRVDFFETDIEKQTFERRTKHDSVSTGTTGNRCAE